MHLSALLKLTLVSYINLLFALPQHNKPYLWLLINRVLKIKYNAFLFKKFVVLWNKPNIYCDFVFIVSTCSDQFKFIYSYTKIFIITCLFYNCLPIFTLISINLQLLIDLRHTSGFIKVLFEFLYHKP